MGKAGICKTAVGGDKGLIRLFEFLINHGADEVIEAEIVFLLPFFIERRLRVGCTFELGFKTTAVLVKEGTLFVGGSVGEFIGVDEGGGTFCRFAEMI